METEGIASYEDAIEGILNRYEGTKTQFSRADAEEEFFSEAMAGLFSTEDGAKQFLSWLNDESKVETNEKKSIIRKMADLLQELFDHIMALIRGGTLSKTAEDFAQMEADRAQMLRQDFLAALDVMKENAEKGTVEGGEKFSIKKSTEGFLFVDVDEDAIDLNDGRSIASVIVEVLKERFKNLITVNGQDFRVNSTTNREWRNSHEARYLLKYRPDSFNDKMKAIANADEILKAARKWIGEEAKHQNFDEYARGFVYYKVGQNGYKADVLVGLKNDGSATLYDLVNVYKQKITEASPHAKGVEKSLRSTDDTSIKNSVSQPAENVNTENVHNSEEDAQTVAQKNETAPNPIPRDPGLLRFFKEDYFFFSFAKPALTAL